MKRFIPILIGLSALIRAASPSQNDDLFAESKIVSDEQLTAESVLPSDGQIDKIHIVYKPLSIKDSAAWSRLIILQDFYDACYDLDVENVSNLIDQMSNFDCFPFEEAIQLAIETSPEGMNDESRRWSIISLLYGVAKKRQAAVDLHKIMTSFSSDAQLKDIFEFAESDIKYVHPFDIVADNSESLHELAAKYKDVKNVPGNLLRSALRNVKSLDEINQTFPELMKSTSHQIQKILINSDISAVSHGALMNAVENALPMAEESINNRKRIPKIFLSIILDLLKSPHAEIWSFVRDLSVKKKNQLEKAISWMASRFDQFEMAFKTSSLKLTEYVYETFERLPSDVRESLLQCLYDNFDKIASLNKDHRVFYFLYGKFMERSQPRGLEAVQIDLDQTSKLPKTPHKFLLHSMQSYLNHVAALSREPHELDLRISLTKEKRQDILQHVFNGVLNQDPILCALFKRRWGLAVKLFRLLEKQDIAITLAESSLHWFYVGLLALPWPLFQKMRQHYSIRTVNREEILLICQITRDSPNFDRRVLAEILGYPTPIKLAASSLIEKSSNPNPSSNDEPSSGLPNWQTREFFDIIYTFITYQLDGWLLEALDSYRCILENQELLNRIDKKYETYNAINRFHSFLLFFKNFILEPSIDAHKAISKEENPDFPCDAVKKLQISFEELKYKQHYSGIGSKLKQKIEWMLQYIVPKISQPFHPDIDTVIFREASKMFLFYLFQENSLFVLERLGGIKSF